MPQDYSGEDPLVLAQRAERDLNSNEAKAGHEKSDSARESGIDASATDKFPGADVTYGSAASGREIPPEQGGGQQRGTGRMTKDTDFEDGEAGEGPEDVARRAQEEVGGEDDVRGNVVGEAKREVFGKGAK